MCNNVQLPIITPLNAVDMSVSNMNSHATALTTLIPALTIKMLPVIPVNGMTLKFSFLANEKAGVYK